MENDRHISDGFTPNNEGHEQITHNIEAPAAVVLPEISSSITDLVNPSPKPKGWRAGAQIIKKRAENSSLEPKSDHTHHWIIETPDGATSKGYCTHCDMVRDDFKNSMDGDFILKITDYR